MKSHHVSTSAGRLLALTAILFGFGTQTLARSGWRSPCLGVFVLALNIIVTSGAAASTQISGNANGDGVEDTVVGEPLSYGLESQTGLVLVFDGITGECMVAIQGEHTGDLFGASIALIHDQDFDGVDELLVGAPGCGKAYLFRSRQFDQSMVRPASSATLVLVAPELHSGSHAINFGATVGSFYDMDGDGTAEFRVGYNEVHSQTGQVVEAAIVFEGQIGAAIASTVLLEASANGQPDPLDGLRSDTDSDGAVTTRDIANVACRLGSSASDVRIDIDHDGEITLLDLFEVIDDAGTTAIGVIDNTPREIGESVFGNWQRAVVRDDGVVAVATSLEQGLFAGQLEVLRPSPIDPVPILFPTSPCLGELSQCNSVILDTAVQAVGAACGCLPQGGITITLVCGVGADQGLGATKPNCLGRSIEIWINPNQTPSQRCLTLAHELWHVAQACALGFCGNDCVEFDKNWQDRNNIYCGEWFAYSRTEEYRTPGGFCAHFCSLQGASATCLPDCAAIVPTCVTPGIVPPAGSGGTAP